MDIPDQIEKQIEFGKQTKFYYVAYPDSVDKYWWQDREGKWKRMQEMSLDHIKASAKLIERDLTDAFSSNEKNFKYYERFIIEPALSKKSELEEVFRNKADL